MRQDVKGDRLGKKEGKYENNSHRRWGGGHAKCQLPCNKMLIVGKEERVVLGKVVKIYINEGEFDQDKYDENVRFKVSPWQKKGIRLSKERKRRKERTNI
jgi:hypothetical protein